MVTDTKNIIEEVEAVVEKTRELANDSIKWYERAANNKRLWAQSLRVIALTTLGIGSVFPLVIEITKIAIPASVSTLIIGFGTGLIVLDRFMGHSTGWMRYILAQLTLEARLNEFEYLWAAEKLSWQETEAGASVDNGVKMINHCREFHSQISQVLYEETQAWAEEFQNNLRNLDREFQAFMLNNKPGNLSLTVENAELYDGGWTLLIDERPVATYVHTGSAAIPSIIAGFHKLTIIAKHRAIPYRCEKILEIKAGEITTETISLPSPKSETTVTFEIIPIDA